MPRSGRPKRYTQKKPPKRVEILSPSIQQRMREIKEHQYASPQEGLVSLAEELKNAYREYKAEELSWENYERIWWAINHKATNILLESARTIAEKRCEISEEFLNMIREAQRAHIIKENDALSLVIEHVRKAVSHANIKGMNVSAEEKIERIAKFLGDIERVRKEFKIDEHMFVNQIDILGKTAVEILQEEINHHVIVPQVLLDLISKTFKRGILFRKTRNILIVRLLFTYLSAINKGFIPESERRSWLLQLHRIFKENGAIIYPITSRKLERLFRMASNFYKIELPK